MSKTGKGHTRNRPHRYVEGGASGKQAGQWASWQELEHAEGDAGTKASIGFVEFRDDGDPLSVEQLHHVSGKVMGLAAEAKAEQGDPWLMIVFIHGWHHNSAEGDDNVISFKKLLRDTQRDENRTRNSNGNTIGTARRVVGIYVGWRGESLGHAHDLINFATLWKRKKVAERIGDRGLPRLMADLNAIRDTHPKHRLVCVGHSLGGAMLFMGVQKKILEGAAQVGVSERLAGANLAEYKPTSSVDFSYGDLTILLNPAIQASRFKQMHEAVKEVSEHFGAGQPLAFASFTSDKDFATRRLFPASRFLGGWSWSRERRKRNRQSYGHHKPYLTTIATTDWGESDKPPLLDRAAFNQAAASWRAYRAGETDEARMVKVTLLDGDGAMHTNGGKARNLPFMNVRTNHKLIADHNAIWTDLFSQFLRVLIGVHFARTPGE